MLKKIAKRVLIVISKLSPKLNSEILYFGKLKKFLNLKNPETFNEKIMWLKLNEYKDNELITSCVDKYEVRKYIEECGCKEILNDLIAVYSTPEEIDFDKLPNQFVLKCNHGAGYNIICKDKNKMDFTKVKSVLNKWLKEDYWALYSEMQYKTVERKIICEKYLESNNYQSLEDYKVYCFNGKPEFVMVCIGRNTGKTKYYFLNKNWEIMRINKLGLEVPENFKINKPKCIDDMFSYAEKLSKPFKFVRVDFYDCNDKVIFGELTFTPSACVDTNYTEKAQKDLGNMIKI